MTGRYVQSDPIGLDGGMNGYGYVNNKPLSLIDKLGLLADDVNAAMSHILLNFNEINPEGGWVFGTMPPGVSGSTQLYSGTIIVDVKYHKECLSEDEFNDMYFTLLHESMHSTDGVLIRTKDQAYEAWTGNLSANHWSIHERTQRERWGFPPQNSMWGFPYLKNEPIWSEIGQLWFQTIPWHCL